MRLRQLLFSPSGRLNREGFWCALCLLHGSTMVGWMLLGPVCFAAVLRGLPIGFVIAFAGVVTAIWVYSCASIFAKRLHDLSLPGWLTFAPLGLFFLAWALISHADDPPGVTSPEGGRGLLLLLAWAILVLCVALKRGSSGENRYGPPPHLQDLSQDDPEDEDDDWKDDAPGPLSGAAAS